MPWSAAHGPSKTIQRQLSPGNAEGWTLVRALLSDSALELSQTLARSGSTKTGPFHGLYLHPVHEEGPPHYGAKAENEHTALLQVG